MLRTIVICTGLLLIACGHLGIVVVASRILALTRLIGFLKYIYEGFWKDDILACVVETRD